MSIRLGKCNNIEFCRLASLQKTVEIPDDEPFICPQCSADLESLGTKRSGGGNRTGMIALQAAAIVAGAGVIGWKVLLAPAPKGAPELHAPRASAAELALAANPDAPTDVPAPAEPKEAAPAPANAPGQAKAAPAKVLLRLKGTDLIAAHLARRLAAGYLTLIGDTDIATEPTADPATIEITGSDAGQREAIAITASPSASALADLGTGGTDVAMTSRAITPAERSALAKFGDMTASGSEHVVGVDALVVVTNPANPAASVSRAQLRAALAGTGANWSALGQPSRPLHVYMPDAAQNSEDGPGAILGNGADLGGAIPVAGTADVLAAVKRDAGGLGIVDWAEAGSAHVIPVSDAAAPVAPAEASVAAEDYPLTRRIYFYNLPAQTTSFSRRFADYAASAPGQAVVAASGFVSLAVRSSGPQAAVAAAPDAAQAAPASAGPVADGTRLSTTFRFQPGSVALDTRAARDIDRLAAYLKTRQIDGSHVMLAGFADNTGTPAANQIVAQKRVETVAASLDHAGITVGATKSFGAEFPVADNATPEGRDKNRRVEVYLTTQ